MEIVEKPKVTCNVCGCVYAFGKDDFKTATVDNGMFQYSLHCVKHMYAEITYVECPVCGKRHIVKERQWDEEKWDDDGAN